MQLSLLDFRDSRVSLLLTYGLRNKQSKHFSLADTASADTNSARAPHCGIGSFEISPESSSDSLAFPSSATSFQSPLNHNNRQQPCRPEPVSVSSMPSANRLPAPASPSLKDAPISPQQRPMSNLRQTSLVSNSSGTLLSAPRPSTSGLPS